MLLNIDKNLIFILSKLLCEEVDEIDLDIERMMNVKDINYGNAAFRLFNLAEYIRITSNIELIEKYKDDIYINVSIISESWNKKQANLFGELNKEVHTSNIGIAFGALYNINLFLKDDNIAKLIYKFKNFVYENNTTGKQLSNFSGGKSVNLDMIFAVVPFGLFAPEDLVLVEAIKVVEDNLVTSNGVKRNAESSICPISTLLLSWYFAEKADYKKSKLYLSMVRGESDLENLFKNIIIFKLKKMKALKDEAIIHIPLGNENRYVSQIHERTPWKPKHLDSVKVSCTTWPNKIEAGVDLIYKVNNDESIRIKGDYCEIKNNYTFDMGSFKGGELIEYYFKFEDKKSEIYSFETMIKETILEIYSDNKNLKAKSNLENIYDIEIFTNDIELNFKFNPSKNTMLDLDEYKIINEKNSLIKLNNKNHSLDVKNIFVWRNSKEILSCGISVKSLENEGFYGFGERYNSINQRGNLVDVYVYNQYKDQGIKTYLPMPYFISSKNYGIYVNSDTYTEFDLCSNSNDFYSIETEKDVLQLSYFIGTPKEVINKFTNLIGRAKMMPEWAFGPWMSSNNWDSELEVRKQVELTKKYDIPSTVMVIEAWSDESTYYIFNDATYKENDGSKNLEYNDFNFPKWGRWPDPKGLVNYLHENNLKCVLWQIPIIKYMNGLHHLQKDNDEKYAIEKGYCVLNEDGSPFRMPEGWFTDSLLFDYTSKEANDWWFSKREYLIKDIGIDGFKTDGGEFVFGNNVKFSNGSTGKTMRNIYPNLYVENYYEYMNKIKEGITFSRAGFTGAQKMPAHWAGDERSTFDAFNRNLCAGINAGLSGIVFWGWDLGGFSGEIPTSELFVRSTQMAAFCPIMQYHAESKAEFNQDRTPWNIAERNNTPWIIDMYRYYAKMRMALIPYIKESAQESVETGVPLMRAMLIEYPNDNVCRDIFDQYMFGNDLLVAPVVIEGAKERSVYLPKGTWRNIFNNKIYEGEKNYDIKVNLDEILVFEKSNSLWSFDFSGEDFSVKRKGNK